MKDRIMKWWNRTWSDWQYDETWINSTAAGRFTGKTDIYKSRSNDGLVRYKQIDK